MTRFKIVTGARPVTIRTVGIPYGTRGAYAPVPRSLLGCLVWVNDGREERHVVEHGRGGARVVVAPDMVGCVVIVERRVEVVEGSQVALVLEFLEDMGFDPTERTTARLLALLADDPDLLEYIVERFHGYVVD